MGTEKNEKYGKLMELANRAKNVRLYDMANIIFAVLLEAVFDAACRYVETGLSLEWETQDAEGCSTQEVYYDLLVIRHSDVQVKNLCIPVPVLFFFSAISALKRATIVSRSEHVRTTREGSEAEISDLWSNLRELVTIAEVQDAVREHLDPHDDDGRPFAARLLGLVEEKLAGKSQLTLG